LQYNINCSPLFYNFFRIKNKNSEKNALKNQPAVLILTTVRIFDKVCRKVRRHRNRMQYSAKKRKNIMLKGIPEIISPELLKILAQMGHGDEIVLSDAHFPAYSISSNVVRADASSSPEMMAAILKLMELDQYVDKPVMLMEPLPGDAVDPELLSEIKNELGKDADRIGYIERFAFYERAKKSFAVVVTGESRIYGNIIIKKGVTLP